VSTRTLLTGPFVNSNHTSEFLELAAFTCLACSFFRRTALKPHRVAGRRGVVRRRCARDDFTRRGRGPRGRRLVFGVLRYANPPEGGPPRRRRTGMMWGLLLVGFVVLGAGALVPSSWWNDSGPAASAVTSGSRCGATDSRVLSAHPLGIGRGAFEALFPDLPDGEDLFSAQVLVPRETSRSSGWSIRDGRCSRSSSPASAWWSGISSATRARTGSKPPCSVG
jgi:hypothetical protein